MIHELQNKYSINSITIMSGLDYQNVSDIPFPAVTINYPIDMNVKKINKDMNALYPDEKLKKKMDKI